MQQRQTMGRPKIFVIAIIPFLGNVNNVLRWSAISEDAWLRRSDLVAPAISLFLLPPTVPHHHYWSRLRAIRESPAVLNNEATLCVAGRISTPLHQRLSIIIIIGFFGVANNERRFFVVETAKLCQSKRIQGYSLNAFG
jgi:hypothetical protein